jgi:hypothetical protein
MDLLAPDAAPISLREQSFRSAQARLNAMEVTAEDDVLIALRRGRILRAVRSQRTASPSKRPGAPLKDRNVDGPMHVMFTLRLISGPDRPDASVHALTFVELVSPDIKVACTR